MPRPAPDPSRIEEARRLFEEEGSYQKAAARMGVAHTTLTRWLGPSPNRGRRIPQDKLDAAREMVEARTPYQRIERALGISRHALVNHFGPSPVSRDDILEHAQEVRRKRFERRYRIVVRLRMEKGMTNREIHEATGISMNFLWRHIGATPRRLGGKNQWDYGLRYRAYYLRECGWSISEIAVEMDIPHSTVGDWVRGMPCG